jgi:uncharacterized membrane protein
MDGFKPELQAKIMEEIRRHEQRILVLKTSAFGASLILSFGLLVVAYLNLATAAVQSGFLEFVSLFFSDFSVAVANFQDFAFSLLESFPVFSTALVVVGIILVVWSAVHFIDDIAAVRAHKHMALLG